MPETEEDAALEIEADAEWNRIRSRWNDPAPEPDPELVRALAEEYASGDNVVREDWLWRLKAAEEGSNG